MKLSAAISLLIPLLLWCAAAAQTPLYFSLILSFGRYGFNSSGTIPAMEIALERVDEMKILPSYKLKNSPVRDSEVREVAAERPTTTPIYVLLPSGAQLMRPAWYWPKSVLRSGGDFA